MIEPAAHELDDLFPHSERVFYRKAPLVQVTCQVRFPPILRIEQAPYEFQEKLRDRFPFLERSAGFSTPQQVPEQILQVLAMQIGAQGWRFLTEDKKTILALSSELLVLTTTQYSKWEEFLENWRPAFNALLEVYNPSFFISVSLRYQDFIDRSDIGLENIRWSELLRKELLAEANDPNIEDCMEGATRALRLRMPKNEDVIVLQHGIGNKAINGQIGYFIDLDFASLLKTEVQNVEPTLQRLHRSVGNAFRWCISDKLHESLDPIPIDVHP